MSQDCRRHLPLIQLGGPSEPLLPRVVQFYTCTHIGYTLFLVSTMCRVGDICAMTYNLTTYQGQLSLLSIWGK